MSTPLAEFLKRWAITTLAVLIAAKIVPGVAADTFGSLIIASLLLGLFNATLRPLLIILSVPLACFSVLLFIIALPLINAGLFLLVGRIVKGFHVDGFWSALFGSLVVSAVSFAAGALARKKGPPPPGPPAASSGPGPGKVSPGEGPIIDV
ncbi:MAG TPA: phage holin family protein [Candidatus Limnocylindria bacterium]|jgi:putative membrane protein|nr:phage holin family protein [Candidatus Limnocylindria bacterium]